MYLVLDEARCRDRAAWTAAFRELVDLEGDGSWCGRVAGPLEIRLAPRRAQITGELVGLVPRVCDRCLAVYLEEVVADVAEDCEIDGDQGHDAVFCDDDEVWRVAPEGRLDLTEIARQAVLLALPTAARCGAGCPAVFAGKPQAAATDPRLAILAELFEPEDDDGSSEATHQ